MCGGGRSNCRGAPDRPLYPKRSPGGPLCRGRVLLDTRHERRRLRAHQAPRDVLSAKRRGARGARGGSGARRPLHTGNAGGGGLPHNPTRLGKDLSALRRVNGLSCAFHDLRHTLATMTIAGGRDVRTAASCLGARERVDGPGHPRRRRPKGQAGSRGQGGGLVRRGPRPALRLPQPPLPHRALVPAASPSRWSSSGPCSPPQRGRGLPVGVLRLAWSYVRRLFRAMSRWM